MKKVTLSIVAVLVFYFSSFSQTDSKTAFHAVTIDIKDFALIDIEGPGNNTSIKLESTTPTEAGLGINFDNASNNTLWLNYSSVVAKGKTRKITAKVDGTLPDGVDLMLKANTYSGNGKGQKGQPSNVAAQKLTSGETEIINNIKSCYTGNGVNNGHNLEYSLRFKDGSEDNAYNELESGTFNINVTYTVSE
ncbi:MAG: hypothetical protein R2757_03655 [Draconibacterium sp.]